MEFGADAETIGLSIADNQGHLRQDAVLARLERQMSVQGLLDENGRGLYLTYSLGGRFIVNLVAGRLTELVVLFPRSTNGWADRCEARPVCIFDQA